MTSDDACKGNDQRDVCDEKMASALAGLGWKIMPISTKPTEPSVGLRLATFVLIQLFLLRSSPRIGRQRGALGAQHRHGRRV